MQRELPDAIDLLTISVESGLGFDAALQQVAHNTEGPLADEFSRVLREMQIGSSRAEALRALAERTNLTELRSFVSAMVQADAFGIPIANVLRVQSSEMRVKRRQRAEEKAQQVPVKMTIPLIFCILPVPLHRHHGTGRDPDHGQLQAGYDRRVAAPVRVPRRHDAGLRDRRPGGGQRAGAATRPLSSRSSSIGCIWLAATTGRADRACRRWSTIVAEAALVGMASGLALEETFQILTALAFPPFTAALRRGRSRALASLVAELRGPRRRWSWSPTEPVRCPRPPAWSPGRSSASVWR